MVIHLAFLLSGSAAGELPHCDTVRCRMATEIACGLSLPHCAALPTVRVTRARPKGD